MGQINHLGFDDWEKDEFFPFVKQTLREAQKKTKHTQNQNILILNILFSIPLSIELFLPKFLVKKYYRKGFFKQKYEPQKILLISGENIYHPFHHNLPSTIRILAKFILSKLGLARYKKPTYQPGLYLLPQLRRKENHQRNYAILSNHDENKHVFSLPFFAMLHFKHFDRLIQSQQHNKPQQKKKFCAFVVSNNDKKNSEVMERIHFFKLLSNYKKIDSYGKALHNTDIPQYLIDKYGNSWSMNPLLFRDYKFVICFENTFNTDYITEKLPNVMLAQSIGIYRGAPNIGEYFNTRSFINYEDYGNYDAMIEEIIALDNDDKAYQKRLNEPFFRENKIPEKLQNIEHDLTNFLYSMVNE